MTNQTRVLIGNDSKEYGHTLARALMERNMYAVTRPKNGRIVLDTALTERYDVLVIAAKMPELDAVSVISEINTVSDYSPLIVVVSNYDSIQTEREVMEAGAAYYVLRPYVPKILAGRIEKLLNAPKQINQKSALCPYNTDPDSIEYVVTDIIYKVGIPAHIKGYHYLRNAIILSVENPEMVDCITKLLYPTIARQYATTASRIERAIRHAIGIAWNNGNVETLNSFFGCTVKGKPTNSEFIALISDRLRLKLNTHSPQIILTTREFAIRNA